MGRHVILHHQETETDNNDETEWLKRFIHLFPDKSIRFNYVIIDTFPLGFGRKSVFVMVFTFVKTLRHLASLGSFTNLVDVLDNYIVFLWMLFAVMSIFSSIGKYSEMMKLNEPPELDSACTIAS